MKHKIKCRYGVTYIVDAKGECGAQARLVELLSRCCCWVCHNHDCKEPRNEALDDCRFPCELYTKKPWCGKVKKEDGK